MLQYYSVSIHEETRTVDAVDENGAVIVSLLFENHEELCSEEFQVSLRDAVALASSDYAEEIHDDHDLMVVLWDEQLKHGGRDDEEQQEMKSLLEMLEREELEKMREEEERDRQYAMALQIQEEEDALQRQGVERMNRRKNPWKTLCYEEEQLEDIEGFPSLPAGTDPQKVSQFKATGNILDTMTVERAGRSLYRDYCDGDVDRVMKDWKQASHISNQVDDFRLGAVEKDDRDFILSAASSAMARGSKEVGVSPESLKKMMSGGGSRKNESTHEILEDIDREKYSRKSIRKLVLDMIAAGWMPLRRGGGHYIYERYVNIPHRATPLKQVLVLPSTPSSQKSIDRVYAKLIKCDRDVAEKIVETTS